MLRIKIKQCGDRWVVSTQPATLWPFWDKTVCETRDEAFDVATKFARRFEEPVRLADGWMYPKASSEAPPLTVVASGRKPNAEDIANLVIDSIDMTGWLEKKVAFDSSFSANVVVEFSHKSPRHFTVISGDSFATLGNATVYEVIRSKESG